MRQPTLLSLSCLAVFLLPVPAQQEKSIANKVEYSAQSSSKEISTTIASLQRVRNQLSELVAQRAMYLDRLSRLHLRASLTANPSHSKPRTKDFGNNLAMVDRAKAHLESARYKLLNARAALKRQQLQQAKEYLGQAYKELICTIDNLE